MVAVVLSGLMALLTLALVALEPETTLSWFLLMLVSASPVLIGTVGAFYARNWGRILLLIFTGLAFPMAFFPGFKWVSWNGAILGVDVLVVVLLFVPSSNEWFRAKRISWGDA